MYHPDQAWRPQSRRCIRGTKRAQSEAHGKRQGFTAAIRATVVAGAVLGMLLPLVAGAAQEFATADLAGTWNVHGLVSGYPDDLQGWVYGTMTCDSNGLFTQRTTGRTGEESPVGGVFEISPEGIIIIPGGSGHGSSFHGVMRDNRDTIVLTGNDAGGGCFLVVYTRSAGTFATNDFDGAWVFHGLISGNEADQVPGWYYYSMTADKLGDARFSIVTDSQGNKHCTVRPCRFSVAANGVVSLYDPKGELPFFHGAMNPAKDTIVAVATMAPGSIEDIRGYNLLVGARQVPGAYAARDLTGTWYMHALVSSSTYNDWTGWYRCMFSVDSQGKGSIVPGSYLNSHGETEQVAASLVSMTSDGIITMSSPAGFHGIMSIGKDMSVATMYDGGGGYGLSISIGRRRDKFDFDGDGDVDFVDFADFADHWLN